MVYDTRCLFMINDTIVPGQSFRRLATSPCGFPFPIIMVEVSHYKLEYNYYLEEKDFILPDLDIDYRQKSCLQLLYASDLAPDWRLTAANIASFDT